MSQFEGHALTPLPRSPYYRGMTNPMNYPQPQELQYDALDDAMWDLIDHRTATITRREGDPGVEGWLYWLTRYQGFAEGELEVKTQNDSIIILGYKD